MIPDRLVDFVHGPILSWIGTRDGRLRPWVAWAFGARVSAASDEITAFVPDVEIDRIKADLRQNTRVAFTVVQPHSHESYQFKGDLVALRPSSDEERVVQDIYRDKLIAYFKLHGHEHYADMASGFALYPSTAITFRVEQAFVQTPGPGAGRVLELAEA